MSNPVLHCRVCGFRSMIPPWGSDDDSPDFDFCPCCRVEAGVNDASPHAARAYRERWLAAGAPWSIPSAEHDGLSTEERLSHVPPGFE